MKIYSSGFIKAYSRYIASDLALGIIYIRKEMLDLGKITDFDGFGWSELHWIELEIETSLNSLRESVKFHENLVKDKSHNLKKDIKKDKYLNSDEDEQFKGQYYTQFYEHEERAINNMKFVLKNSTLLSVFTVFEGKLKELCELIEKETASKLKHSDLKSRNGDIGQFMKYLTHVFGMTIKESENLLSQIKIHKIVRNKIAHTSGKIEKENIKELKKLRGVKIISKEDVHIIYIVSSDYLLLLINLIEDFFKQLLYEVDNRIKEVRNGNRIE